MFGLESVLIQGLFKITLAIFGLLAARATLIWMDKDEKFISWLDQQHPKYQVYYRIGRFAAVAFVVGAAIS